MMENYSAIKKNKVLTLAVKSMQLEVTVLSAIRQTQREINISFLVANKKKKLLKEGHKEKGS